MAQSMHTLQHQQLPPEAALLAEQYQLGTAQTQYRVGLKNAFTIYRIVVCGLAGVILTLFALGSSDNVPVLILLLLFGLPFLGMALYYLSQPVLYRSWRVYTCTDGFVFVQGNNAKAFRWDQIESMRNAVTRRYIYGIYVGTIHRYTIRRKDGVQVVFKDRFADVETLGNTISHALTRCLLPQVIEAYNTGRTITFGPLSVNLQGVSNGRELLPWSQIKELRLNRGIVTVRKEGKWLNWSSIRAAKIPNFFVFMALVDYVLKGQK